MHYLYPILLETFEMIVETLNNTAACKTNAQNAINKLSFINETIRSNNSSEQPQLSPIPQPVMTPNQTTATLQQFDEVSER